MTFALTRRQTLVGAGWLSASIAFPSDASKGEAFPERPIRLLVGAGAGSVPDLIARLVGEKLSATLGQPVVIDDRPGAGGMLAMQALVGSKPDGYTLALATMSQAVFDSYLFSKLPYDPLHDLDPISSLVVGAMAVAANPGLPANTFGELISLANSQANKLTLGVPGNGSPPHLVALLLVRAAGINVEFVPFRTGPDGLAGVMRGDVQLFIDAPPLIAPQAKAGAIKVLAVTGEVREAELPGVPTIAELGFPAVEGEAWMGLVAPVHTPPAIVARLNSDIGALMAAPDVQRRLAALSFRPFVASQDQFIALIREEHKRWGSIIRDAGIRLD